MNILQHIFHDPFAARRALTETDLQHIQRAITLGEARHRGEVCFALESHIPLHDLLRGCNIRQRALTAFHTLGIGHTPERNGVLIYLCMAGRHIEIIADEGLNGKVSGAEWDRLIGGAATHFARGDFKNGALQAVGEAHDLLIRHFPGPCPGPRPGNALPDTVQKV